MDSLAVDDCLSDMEIAIGRPLLSYLNTAPIPVTLLSVTGIVLWANDSNLSLLGCTRSEYLYHDLARVRKHPPTHTMTLTTLTSASTSTSTSTSTLTLIIRICYDVILP